MQIRTTKFPYFFWGFNRAYECDLDFEEHIYKNLEVKTEYRFKKINSLLYLIIKYLPIFFIFYFTFNKFDFSFSKTTILSHILAFILVSIVNLLDGLFRQIVSILAIFSSIFFGFYIDEIFLVAYVLKYFLFFSVFIMIFLDTRLQAYSILNDNGKVLSNFTIPKSKK
ncbi:hypothetical protein LMG7974_01616 [Campylobacter majalis]|uniref:Uncharacterized protein n=1 Tax=Campylobacter majalis TaxID=2790656 RepID=A0ABN7KAP1_9BACT|nr:hypothetical protein [Campylobacter majalis]CAD7289539.1 hypothetical protein LMG7974_01616 [Campylobacter majalis]